MIDVTLLMAVAFILNRPICANFGLWPGGRLSSVIELVNRDVILPVRHGVLRPNLPLESAKYPEDNDPEVFHLAARDERGAVIGCVTFLPEPFEGRERSWRFRGMATLAEHRNRGLGGEILEAGIAEAAKRGAERVWCNGRTAARAFYVRHGFVTVGAEFTLPPGYFAHYVFVRELRPDA